MSEVYVNNYKEALACEKAGIDMIITSEINDIYKKRKNSQNIFLTVGLVHGKHVTEKKILKASYRALKLGADAIYCPQGIKFVKALSHEDIAVIDSLVEHCSKICNVSIYGGRTCRLSPP